MTTTGFTIHRPTPTPRRPRPRRIHNTGNTWFWFGTVGLIFAMLIIGVITFQDRHRIPPNTVTLTGVLHLYTTGDLQYAQGRYTDSYGTNYDTDLDADTQVTGMTNVILITYGLDPGCRITLNGRTIINAGADNGGDPTMAICQWPHP